MEKKLDTVLDYLYAQCATEATTVADMLETIASNDDPDTQSPEFLAGCLDELIAYAQKAKDILIG